MQVRPESSARGHGKVLYLGPPIRLLSDRLLKGCNRYHSSSVIQQRFSFGLLANVTSEAAGPDFAPAYVERFGTLRSFLPDNGLRPDFVEQLHSEAGAAFHEVLLEAVLAVEHAVAFARHDLETIAFAAVEPRKAHTSLIWSCAVARLSRGAARVALLGLLELLPDTLNPRPPERSGEFETAWRELRALAQRRRLSPATAVLMQAARQRGLACATIGRQHLRIGLGSAQRQLYASMTATTTITAQKICADKRLTNRRLSELRLPVPRQFKVASSNAARTAAEKLGFPVVLKPSRGKKGAGVTAKLATVDGIEAAYERASGLAPDVLVEEHLPGADHRLLVVGGRFVAALSREPPAITGDGVSTVEQLIEQLNADPNRDGFRLFMVRRDVEVDRMLGLAGIGYDDVLAEGRTVALRAVANISTGGVPIDVTDEVHPDNRELAERVAVGVGLDVAGVDFVTTDISRSYREVGGGIIEVNARPGLDIHIWPLGGRPRDVAGEVLKLSFPPGEDGGIPIVAVAGDKGTGPAARILDWILRGTGNHVALVLRNGAYIGGDSAELSRAQLRRAAPILLCDPQVDMLISTVSLRQVMRRGLVLEQCTVSVIMDKMREEETALFHAGIEVLARATTDCFVVGASNRVALDRLGELGARRLILVAERAHDPVLRAHLGARHTAVTTHWQDDELRIVVLRGSQCMASFPIDLDIPSEGNAGRRRTRPALMFAVAAAIALGLEPEVIAEAIAHGHTMVAAPPVASS